MSLNISFIACHCCDLVSSKKYKLQNCGDFFFLSSSIWYHLFVSNVEWKEIFFFFFEKPYVIEYIFLLV